MFNKRRQLQSSKTDRPSLHQIGDRNVFVLGSEKEIRPQSEILERLFDAKSKEGKISLIQTEPRESRLERRNPKRRIKIDGILRTSTISNTSKNTIVNLLKIINRSLKTEAERDVALRVIKTFLGE